jgi:hypothetical protein
MLTMLTFGERPGDIGDIKKKFSQNIEINRQIPYKFVILFLVVLLGGNNGRKNTDRGDPSDGPCVNIVNVWSSFLPLTFHGSLSHTFSQDLDISVRYIRSPDSRRCGNIARYAYSLPDAEMNYLSGVMQGW